MSGVRCRGFVGLCVAVPLLLVMTAAGASAQSDAQPTFSAHGSVQQVYVTGMGSGAEMSLVNRHGQTIATQRANGLGGLLFRNVPAGNGYRVRPAGGGVESDPLTVLSTRPAPPSTDIYNQSIPSSGYGYLTTRDGIELAIYVHPPQDVANALPLPGGIRLPQVGDGPYPTLIEYSGYGFARRAVPRRARAVTLA